MIFAAEWFTAPRWRLPSLGGRHCPIFVHYTAATTKANGKTNGWRGWLNNLIGVLEQLGEPELHRVGSGTIPQDDKHIAYFVQSFRDRRLATRIRSGFHNPTFHGPFITNKLSRLSAADGRSLNQTVVICENTVQRSYCRHKFRQVGINASCIVSPVGISDEVWRPTLPRSKRKLPLILQKDLSRHVVDPTLVDHIIASARVSARTNLFASKHGLGSYSQSQYRTALS